MSEETEREQQESEEVALSIDWHVPEGLQSRYANNILVQAGPYEFIISFFEAQIPMLTGSPEENRARLTELGKIRAECVSKIIVSPELMPGLINALQIELDKYQSQKLNQQRKDLEK
jgi:hypothetical protein